jgi:hypothetical protein
MASYSTYNIVTRLSSCSTSALDAGLDAFLAAGKYRKLDGSIDGLATYQTDENYQWGNRDYPFMTYAIVASVGKETFVILCNDADSYREFMREYSASLPLLSYWIKPLPSV